MSIPVFTPGFQLPDGTALENLVQAIFGTGPLANANFNPQGGAGFTNLWISGFLQESYTDTITASATQTQAAATQLTTEMNRVTTVATAGNGVKLPVSAPGLTIILENAGANAMQVYGSGTDTINGAVATVGVSQMQNSVVIFTCYTAGAWFAANLGTGYAGSLETQSSTTGITAHAGGGQASATQLTTMVNNVTVTATAGDSVVLPGSAIGLQITVANNGANSLNVFCPVGSTMNGTSNGSSALAAGTVGIYFCVTATGWISK